MSWNILASEWIKPSYYPKIDKNILLNRTARFNRIFAIIKETNADIILLQEVMPLEYESLKQYLKKQYTCSQLVSIQWKYSNESNKSGNMTLLRRTLLNIKHSELDFGVLTELPQLLIFNIHLDDLSGLTRNKQMRSIEKLLYQKPKCIIGGDFNQMYRKTSKLYNLPEFTVHNIICPTYYIEGKMNIDNIMTRGFKENKDSVKCIEYPKSMKEGIETYGTDHLPIIVEI